MVSRTGIGIGIGIPFMNKVKGGGVQPLPPDLQDALVGVWIADQNNNNSSNRDTIKNKIPNAGGDFELLNFAYKLNSGYGKYEEDFSIWRKSRHIEVEYSNDGSKLKIISENIKDWWVISPNDGISNSFRVKITNCRYPIIWRYTDDGNSYKDFLIDKDGIYDLPQSISNNEGVVNRCYFGSYTQNNDYTGLTIEQIPSFQGALVTDGIDDLITSSKTVQEMLGGSNEITVVSMIHKMSSDNNWSNLIGELKGNHTFVANKGINTDKTGIYGYTYNYNKNAIVINNILGDKNDYTVRTATSLGLDNKYYVTGFRSAGIIQNISQIAWYWTFIANKVLTTDQINQVIAYYNLDKYVKPYIYYDVKKQGLSNNTPDADWYLKDFSGNGRDMQLYNFAKKLGSGVGKYEADYSTWNKHTGITSTPFGFKITGEISSNYWLVYTYNTTIPAHKVKVSGIPEGGELRYANESIKLENGINELPEMEAAGATGFTINLGTTQLSDWTGLSVEQIPDYEGALVFDAVDDYGKVENLPIYKDYTVVADREIVDGLIDNADGGVATRGTKWDAGAFCFDYKDGVYSFGATNSYVDRVKPNRFISYMSKYIHNGITTPVGDAVDNNPLCIAKLGSSIDRYSKLALWSLLLFPYTLSEFLLERQLKRYKLGSIYPSNSIVFRPYITSNLPYNVIEIRINNELVYYWINQDVRVDESGKYFPKGSTMNIRVKHDNTLKIPSKIKYNGKEYETSYYANGVYQVDVTLDKTPQKIEIQIDEYIRYEDIVQPYPCIVPIIDTNGKTYSWGDKIKVGTEIQGGIIGIAQANLLPDLYKVTGYFNFNGVSFAAGIKHVIGKTNVFELTNAPTYLKANEPNCIADPQRLRIPNSSYKILGYIPDISGHGNHLKINNSAYAGMSGANGYKYDWNTWTIVGGSKIERTDSLFTNKLAITTPTWGLLPPRNTVTDTFKIKVEGLKTGNIYWTYRESEKTYKKFYIYNDGEYELPAPISESDGTGFIFDTGTNAGVIVRQIEQYEGSFCLDGVEDYLTIPTLSHGAKQVLMKVRSFKPVCTIYEQRTPTGVDGGWIPTFCIFMNNQAIAYVDGNNGNTYIDGILNTSIQGKQLVDITHNITVTNENTKFGNTQSPLIGKLATSNTLYAQMALFAFMSFDDISSEEEIKELNDIVGIEGGYVESPDYYWDAYGKANRATQDIDYLDLNQAGNANRVLIDKSKAGLAALELYHNTGNVRELNNRRLVANNFAFNEESGYVDNGLVSDGVEDHLINTVIPEFNDFTVITKRKFLNTELKLNECFCMKGNKGYTGGIGNAFIMEYFYIDDPTSKQTYMFSFGGKNILPREDSDITWCTSTSYNGIEVDKGEGGDTVGLSIGKYAKVYWKGVFYKMMLYSKTIDMLSINMLKNLFAKDELIDVNNPIFKK